MGRWQHARQVDGVVGTAAAALLALAVVRELRVPRSQRAWHGRVLGVPYDLRRATRQRVRERLWAPDDPHLLHPHVFGVGWTINVGRLARRLTDPGAAGA